MSALGVVAACSSGSGSGSGSSGGDGNPSSTPATQPSSTATASPSLSLRPRWATPAQLRGEVAAGEAIAIQVHLQLRDPAGAAAELGAISDPDNAAYGHFLTDSEYDAKYGPTDADVAAVRAHLEANGLQVTEVPANRTYVAARGTASQVSRAFSTRLGLYNVGSTLRRAPIDVPSLPSAIAPRVAGVLGLSSPLAMRPHVIRRDAIPRPSGAVIPAGAPAAIGGSGSCSEWFGSQPDPFDPSYGANYPALTMAPCGYTPAQIREAYGFTKSIRQGNDGTGVAVAVVDAYLSPTLLSDVQTYSAQNDADYPFATSQLVTYQAPGTATAPDPDWWEEQTLDVEAAHAIAPGATIIAVAAQSQSDQDLVAAVNLIISQKLATIVSNSYETQDEAGLTDALIWESIATQAGLKGVGLYFSSGDSGDNTYGGFYQPSISFPGSLPTITSVGGTSVALGQDGQRLWETGWETGVSFLEESFPQPPPPIGDDAGDDAGPPPTSPDAGSASDDGGSAPSVVSRSVVNLDVSVDGGIPFFWEPAPPGEFVYGGGGGVSILFPQPTYQAAIVPPSIANAPGVAARVIPDVSMVGDPSTGFLLGETFSNGYEETVIGGTSLSSPLFAGTMALAQQNAKKTFGFANTLLYKASSKGAFNDPIPLASPQAVTVEYGVVTTFDFEALSIHTTPGYDDVTGLGTPNGVSFLAATK